MGEFKEQGQSEWDMRQLFNRRLDNAITVCSEGMITKNYGLWLNGLQLLEIALKPLMKPEQEMVLDKKMRIAKNLLRANPRGYNLSPFFQKAQEELHRIMRSRGLDIPINEFDPGSIVMRERSF